MIDRLYIHNFRCLDNFELPIADISSALLVGKNGAGKSSVGLALEILQKIGRGNNRIKSLIQPQDMSFGRTDTPVRIELEVTLAGVRYAYRLALELPAGFSELRVHEESLSIDGVPMFEREIAEVRFSKSTDRNISMNFDWHLIWLSVAQARTETDPLEIFRKWLSRILVLRPYPQIIDGDSIDETLSPSPEMDNLGAWWTGLISHSPSSYSRIETSLKRLMPDLSDIKNPIVAKDSRSLEIHFDNEAGRMFLPLRLLSDGEKCMIIWSLVMAANEAYGPLFCFWDEPDNYLAISEIGDFATDLRKAFKNSGQFLATSHNAETIRSFSDENTFVLFRRNHREPTQIRPLSEINYTGDLIAALVRGDIEP